MALMMPPIVPSLKPRSVTKKLGVKVMMIMNQVTNTQEIRMHSATFLILNSSP